jgi:hypothetical protein
MVLRICFRNIVLVLETFEFRICLGFRASDFEFDRRFGIQKEKTILK